VPPRELLPRLLGTTASLAAKCRLLEAKKLNRLRHMSAISGYAANWR